jgi:hypothetical protein
MGTLNGPALLFITAGMAALVGCSKNEPCAVCPEYPEVAIEIVDINDQSPVQSAYLSTGPDGVVGTIDDFLPEDSVPVTFRVFNASNPEVPPGDHYVVMDEFDILWRAITLGGEALTDYTTLESPTHIVIPLDETVTVGVLIASRRMKDIVLLKLFQDGSSFEATCELRFRGTPSWGGASLECIGSVHVSFVGVTGPTWQRVESLQSVDPITVSSQPRQP